MKINLKDYDANSLAEDLNALFDHKVTVERIKVGNRQSIETLISEEALLLAKYLRGQRATWEPRIVHLL